jgi:hypothetical protein
VKVKDNNYTQPSSKAVNYVKMKVRIVSTVQNNIMHAHNATPICYVMGARRKILIFVSREKL